MHPLYAGPAVHREPTVFRSCVFSSNLKFTHSSHRYFSAYHKGYFPTPEFFFYVLKYDVKLHYLHKYESVIIPVKLGLHENN